MLSKREQSPNVSLFPCLLAPLFGPWGRELAASFSRSGMRRTKAAWCWKSKEGMRICRRRSPSSRPIKKNIIQMKTHPSRSTSTSKPSSSSSSTHGSGLPEITRSRHWAWDARSAILFLFFLQAGEQKQLSSIFKRVFLFKVFFFLLSLFLLHALALSLSRSLLRELAGGCVASSGQLSALHSHQPRLLRHQEQGIKRGLSRWRKENKRSS